MDSFYRAFEDRYRGSRELIKSRLMKYLPFIEPLATLYPGEKTFDLGCGRGEWLELMVENGFDPLGADLDADMLEACRERNLPVLQTDAIAHLATLESNSHVLISAFHVVEHVSFDQLRTLVSEALRVLKPGGLLILETPNPENISVATSNFFLDPSHQKPIPALLLSFVAEYAGFDRVKMVRLQETPELSDAAAPVGFLDVLRGASPDYAIVAQKDAAAAQGVLDAAFAADYGLTIDALAHRYEAKIASIASQLDARLNRTQEQLDSLGGRLHMEEHQRHQVEERLEHAESHLRSAEHYARHAEEVANQANAQLNAVYRSMSWRVTAPMRLVSLALRGKLPATVKQALRPVLVQASQYAGKRPWLRQAALVVLDRMPRVKTRLARVAAVSAPACDPTAMPNDVEHLGEHANRIHASLVAEFDKLQRESD